jgi:truncated hemoglobin YjbI
MQGHKNKKVYSTSIIMSAQQNVFNNLLALRLGGESEFGFVVMEFCGKIMADPELQPIYEDLDVEDLCTLQEEFLSLVFGEIPQDMNPNGKIVIRQHALFEKGLNETHYDKVVEHFEDALRECWIEPDVIDELSKTLKQHRTLFERGERENKWDAVLREVIKLRVVEQVETCKKEVRSRNAPTRSSSSSGFTKKFVDRSASGEGLLAMLRGNESKRTKREVQ